jgi:hypothetical protein
MSLFVHQLIIYSTKFFLCCFFIFVSLYRDIRIPWMWKSTRATCSQDSINTEKMQIAFHDSLGVRTHDYSVRTGEGDSCLKWQGYVIGSMWLHIKDTPVTERGTPSGYVSGGAQMVVRLSVLLNPQDGSWSSFCYKKRRPQTHCAARRIRSIKLQ